MQILLLCKRGSVASRDVEHKSLNRFSAGGSDPTLNIVGVYVEVHAHITKRTSAA